MQIGNHAGNHKSAALHEDDFAPPIYNIWKQQEKTTGASHFGALKAVPGESAQ